MQEDEKQEFGQLLAGVMSMYRQDTSAFSASVWWEACKPFSMLQVRHALTSHALDPDRGAFAPKPADMIRQLSGTRSDQAAIAWGKAFEAMQRIGAYTDVVFDDPAIHAAIADMGGWPKVCRTELELLGIVQHRFCESYRAYTQRGVFEYPKMLAGDRSPDSVYQKHGMPAPQPVLIGDEDAAKRTYEGGAIASRVPMRIASAALGRLQRIGVGAEG